MPDGLTAAEQDAVLKKLLDGEYELDAFHRKSAGRRPTSSASAKRTASDPKSPARGLDTYFGHGVRRSEGLRRLALPRTVAEHRQGPGRQGEVDHERGPSETRIRLRRRLEAKKEGFAFVEFDFLEKVKLRVHGVTAWRRSRPIRSWPGAEVDKPASRCDKEVPQRMAVDSLTPRRTARRS